MEKTNSRNEKNHQKTTVLGLWSSKMEVKSQNSQKAHLYLPLNTHWKLQPFSSIWKKDMRGLNSKNKKICTKYHFFGDVGEHNEAEKSKPSKYTSFTSHQIYVPNFNDTAQYWDGWRKIWEGQIQKIRKMSWKLLFWDSARKCNGYEESKPWFKDTSRTSTKSSYQTQPRNSI